MNGKGSPLTTHIKVMVPISKHNYLKIHLNAADRQSLGVIETLLQSNKCRLDLYKYKQKLELVNVFHERTQRTVRYDNDNNNKNKSNIAIRSLRRV